MDFQVNEHARANPTLNPLSSVVFETSSKTNSGVSDVNILLREGAEVVNGARAETSSIEERRKVMSDSEFRGSLHSQTMMEPSTMPLHHADNKFFDIFQLKRGCYADLPAAKIAEMMKSNSFDKAPTQSLLSLVNGILDECLERNNGEIPHHVTCLLRKVGQEIERRIATQAEHLRMQSSLFKAREEKYKSRIQVLEAIAATNYEETKIVRNQLQQIKNEQTIMEQKAKIEAQEVFKSKKEKNDNSQEILFLKQELEVARKTCEWRCLQIESEARKAQDKLEERLKEAANLLTDSKKRIKELETISELKVQDWNRKERIYHIFAEFQLSALQDLRFASQSIRQEVVKTQNIYTEEFDHLGGKVHALEDATRNYHDVLTENQKLHNEVQDLRGNIRVYCRIRPFLPQKEKKLSTIEYIGENGELVIVHPSKPGKEARRSFQFNKVYGPSSTQDEVFSDIQPLVQSVLDGYNVCIFAYGQTGSGKTYTMMGPYGATEEQCGVNYRALNSLFHLSHIRESTFTYEIGVQMVEIYNEQVRDLLSSSSSQKKLGILSTSQPNCLAVPDASMHSVNSTIDVMELMDIGRKNRAQGSTILNERSSRSHSIVTIHVLGTDLKTGSSLRSSLHLVDLAGSERVDRSEVIGDRLKEAQHINKSLSALGDVIFALAQKSSHVPYRNSKLTQVLQSSLGGQAKTLMFVQLNPDTASYSESVSTLKFAERVSGVELGAARSSKDGKGVRELMEQVASLKDTIAKKDEEIERLQLLKDLKNVYSEVSFVKQFSTSLSYGCFSAPTKALRGDTIKENLFGREDSGLDEKASTSQDNYSEGGSEHHSDVSSQNYDNDFIRHCKDLEGLHQVCTPPRPITVHSLTSSAGQSGFRGNAENEKRLSDDSNSDLSIGTENVDFNERKNLSKTSKKKERPKTASRIPRASTRSPMDFPNASTGMRKSSSGTNLSTKSARRWN